MQSNDHQKARRLFKQGRHDSAINRLNAWLRRHPMDAHAHLDLAAPLFALGHLLEAEEAARKAAALKEDFSEAWAKLATIQAARGQVGSP
ncbi:MAG: tetratricopeptide repeat protein, partial [Myxococcota bacterium]